MNTMTTAGPTPAVIQYPARRKQNITNRDRAADLGRKYQKMSEHARLLFAGVLLEQLAFEADKSPECRSVRYALDRTGIGMDQAVTNAEAEAIRAQRAQR
jgi:hypothetical protein